MAAWGPAVAACHPGRGCRLINEHQTVRIEVELTLEPRLARLRYVWTILLGSVESPFYG